MAVIYLRHPVHGMKVATMDLEANADIENGWERFDPNEVTADAEPDTVRRRGRRPKVDNDDDSGRSDQRGVEASGGFSGGRNAFSRDIPGRADSSESDDRLMEH